MRIIVWGRHMFAPARSSGHRSNSRSTRSCGRSTWPKLIDKGRRFANLSIRQRTRPQLSSEQEYFRCVLMSGLSKNASAVLCGSKSSRPEEVAQRLAYNRREFLRDAAHLALGSVLLRSGGFAFGSASPKRKIVVITFGGGARDQETFAPEGQENIPHLMRELIPQSTFFTQVVNRGILGHYVATASLATGVYETINNFASLPPENPTVFEYFRKDLKRPASDAWVVAPSNGFNRIGESSHRSYGTGQGARVILPKHLLTAASKGGADYEHLLRDNYETPFFAPEIAGNEFELEQLRSMLKLSVNEFKARALTLSSPDELSVYIVRQLMRQVAPSLLWITMHDIDVAHAGAFSL